jgi:peptidoglycan/LPS O-acetylase OafA/YrhL
MFSSVNSYALFAPIAAIALALITISLLHRFAPLNLPSFRYTSIDGLRGYLAFFVFLHHAYIWHGYIHTGTWGLWNTPIAPLFRYFGSASVMVFFMITAFLFFGRLLDSKKNGVSVNWLHLYSSRLLRISPLFLFTCVLAFIVAGYAYNWKFNCDLAEFLHKLFLTFGMGLFKAPVIDSFVPRGIEASVTAGALWTLPYEWTFYFFLPILALLLRIKISKYLLLIPALAICYLIFNRLPRVPANAFISGMLVAMLMRTNLQKYLRTKTSALLAISLIIFAIFTFEDPYGFYPLLILTFFFSNVASGNSFFGILHLKLSRVMGEISFGIYLLHGIVLFVLMKIIFSDTQSIALSEREYWQYILICTPILIFAAYMTFRLIEKPCMAKSKYLSEKIRGILKLALAHGKGGRSIKP